MCNTIFWFYKYILWFSSAIMQHIWPSFSKHAPIYWPLGQVPFDSIVLWSSMCFFLCTAVNYNVSIHPEVDMFILQLNFHICSSYVHVSWHNRRIFAVKRTLYWAFYLPLVKTHDFTVMNINDVYMFSVICHWPQTVHV